MVFYRIVNDWDTRNLTRNDEWVYDGRESTMFATKEEAECRIAVNADADRLTIERVEWEDEETPTQHIPAPWVLDEPDLFLITYCGIAVAKAMDNCDKREETLANAPLIAAAPAMLAALRDIADFLERTAEKLENYDMPGNAGNCTIRAKIARDVIAAATA